MGTEPNLHCCNYAYMCGCAGTLSRVLERGTRSIAVMFRAVVFTFIPTAIELVSIECSERF